MDPALASPTESGTTPGPEAPPDRGGRPGPGDGTPSFRIDLLRTVPGLRWVVTRRWFQFAVVLPNVLFFVFFLIAGIFGSPVGNRNIIIIFVWILWWFLLIAFMVPFASRVWCAVCPFPFFGEWFQRRTLIGARVGKPGVGRNRMYGLIRKWPKALSNIWLQNIGFLAMCTFSACLVTRPIATVIALGSLFVIATIMHLIFRQRAFCMYVCPVSGFLSLYSMSSMVEVRPRNREVCDRCKDKGCLAGNDRGWGCPWLQYPSRLERNNYCGFCMECLKTCRDGNMTIQARPPFADDRIKGYDEAWKAFIMITLALAYSVTLLGPFGTIKDWANAPETGQWGGFLLYAAGLWGSALVILPGLFLGAVLAGRRLAGRPDIPVREVFLGFSYLFVPMGLMAWIAFSLPLMFVNGSYVLSVISDPMGRGWDLFGTAHVPWTPVYPEWVAHLQVPVLLLGFVFALRHTLAVARRSFGAGLPALLGSAPVILLACAMTCGFLKLFVG